MKRMRKGIVAGVLAALLALATAVLEGNAPHNVGGWASLVMMSVAAGIVAGVATYKVRNVGPGINEYGSETQPNWGGTYRSGRVGGNAHVQGGVAPDDPPRPPRPKRGPAPGAPAPKTTGDNPR